MCDRTNDMVAITHHFGVGAFLKSDWISYEGYSRNAPYKSGDLIYELSDAIRQMRSMPNYRRQSVTGGTYFITQVTYQRQPWLCSEVGRQALREAIVRVRQRYPFAIDAFVLLPEHFHCLLTLPQEDRDLSVRLRLIKTYVTKHYGSALAINRGVSLSRQKRGERNLWQRRFWEHLIRDERDFALHCDYIHVNPVNHNLCKTPQEWEFSSIHRFIAEGIYPSHWGRDEWPQACNFSITIDTAHRKHQVA